MSVENAQELMTGPEEVACGGRDNCAVPALLARVRELEAEKARIAPLFENLSREYPVECNKRVKADAERDAALSTIAKVEALHQHDAVFRDKCSECSDFGTDEYPAHQLIEWPCLTIRALGSVPSTGEGSE